MSLPIVQDFVPQDHPIRSHLPMAARYITIHETANTSRGANDAMHAKYIKSPAAIDRTVLWHVTVDEDSITQHLPWDEVGWHAGDGYNGVGNRQSIAIEMCVNEDGDFAKTQALTAKLIAHLYATVPTLLPFPEGVVQHNRWSGKDCPRTLRNTPKGWEKFMALVKDAITPPVAEVPKVKYPPIRVKLPTGRVIYGEVRENNVTWVEAGATWVPLRACAELLGAKVEWLDADRGVVVSLPQTCKCCEGEK